MRPVESRWGPAHRSVKSPLPVEGDHGILGQVVDQFHLVGLVLHQFQSIKPGQFKALQLQLFLADLAHFGFDGLQMLLGEVEGCVKIVVEAVFDSGANGQLHFGVQALDSLRHDVGAGVPIRFAVFGVFKRVDVFFGHDMCLLFDVGAKKIPPLRFIRGEM